MKKMLLTASALVAIASAGPALAQNTNSNSQLPSQAASKPNQNLAAAQKIQQDLQGAGFKDVKVVAESFVVQAKTKDGNPVLMTIGPHGMSVFETMNTNTTGANTGNSSQHTAGTSGQNPSK